MRPQAAPHEGTTVLLAVRPLVRDRVAVTLTFALLGGLLGAFTARIPALVAALDLSDFRLGTALFVWGAGAIVTMQALRFTITRVGTAWVLRATIPLYPLSLALVSTAPTYQLLLLEMALFGATFGAVEAAACAQGCALERAAGRPMMSTLQAGWPIGAAVGGLLSAACAQAGIAAAWSLCGLAAISLPLALGLARTAADHRPPDREPERSRGRVAPVVYLLGLIAFAAYVLEGALTDWPGVLLHEDLGTSQAVAALAYPVFQIGMLTGRLRADRVQTRLGVRATVIGAGVTTAAVMLTASVLSAPMVVLVGGFAAGVGISPLVPAAVSMAGRNGDAAVAQFGAIGFVGVLVGPFMIGTIAEVTSLRTSLAMTAVLMGVAIVVGGRLLPGKPNHRRPM
jgi:predicted MFS family arabinose efflux permease